MSQDQAPNRRCESAYTAVFDMVRRIPPGRVCTYGTVARLVGRPGAARVVGYAMHRCPPGLPWHRVINAQGRISLPADSTAGMTQRRRLEEEGVVLIGGRVDLARFGWPDDHE
ncbi:methylated-DNA--protein-cysteine methyltransferase [Salinisphaera sp. S4-8]|uniref:MGMT family protein n=1 Tax=Salinisphaera sp. S4-8 TaxID=633357 RepID=UPI00333F8AFD